jgi:transposase
VQHVTGQTVKLAFADEGYAGDTAAQAARDEGIELQVIERSEAKKCFVLLPRRWVVVRSFGWLNRFRRQARDYEPCPKLWPARTSLSSPSSCSFMLYRLSKVPNTL